MTMSNFSRDDNGNITIKQGTTAGWVYVIYEADGTTVRDITNWTARMQVRSTYNSATPLLTLTTANGKIVNGGATGELAFTILPSDTTYVPAVSGVRVIDDQLEAVYDIEVVDLDGIVWDFDKGTFTIQREVTRD
jgi:hypothetical protein